MLYLNSNQMTKRENSHYEVALPDAIVVDHGYRIAIQVVSASIPCSWYNIKNETLIGVSIPDGNYSATELAEYLLANVPNMTAAVYSPRTLKYTFTFSVATDIPASKILGFSTYSSAALIHTSDQPVKLYRTKNIYVRIPEWSCSNMDSFTPGRSGVFASIPLDRRMGEIQTFSNGSDTTTPIFQNVIKNFTIVLCDDDHNTIDLQGLGFTVDFYLEITDVAGYEPMKPHPSTERERFSLPTDSKERNE
jgi:hypothetical protein